MPTMGGGGGGWGEIRGHASLDNFDFNSSQMRRNAFLNESMNSLITIILLPDRN